MKTIVLVSIFLLFVQPQAFAKKKRPPKGYSFITDAGKASQLECDGEWKFPKLKKRPEMAKSGSYMGSELIDSQIVENPKDEMWKHFYKDKGACNSALAKSSSLSEDAQKKNKPELPQDEPADGDDDAAEDK